MRLFDSKTFGWIDVIFSILRFKIERIFCQRGIVLKAIIQRICEKSMTGKISLFSRTTPAQTPENQIDIPEDKIFLLRQLAGYAFAVIEKDFFRFTTLRTDQKVMVFAGLCRVGTHDEITVQVVHQLEIHKPLQDAIDGGGVDLPFTSAELLFEFLHGQRDFGAVQNISQIAYSGGRAPAFGPKYVDDTIAQWGHQRAYSKNAIEWQELCCACFGEGWIESWARVIGKSGK